MSDESIALNILAYMLSNHKPEYDLLLILGNGD